MRKTAVNCLRPCASRGSFLALSPALRPTKFSFLTPSDDCPQPIEGNSIVATRLHWCRLSMVFRQSAVNRQQPAVSYRTARLSALPGVKRTTRRFGILMEAPVRGLRATRARRWDVLKVPKPTNVIGSPFFNARVMPSSRDSTAAAALL
jgi:hypothetical protein